MMRAVSFIVAFFALVLCVFASPVPEKRITHTGRGTWYEPGLGNCGYTDSASDAVVAIGKGLYDENDAGNCNQWIQITNEANGQSVYAKTRDSCPGCSNNDLDMSPAVFEQIADLDTGVITIDWHFMAKSWSP